jgi:hypothetical protein
VVGDVFYVSDVDLDKTVGFDIATGKAVYNIDRGEYNPMVSDGQRLYLTGDASITGLAPKRDKPKRDGKPKGSKRKQDKGSNKGSKGKRPKKRKR